MELERREKEELQKQLQMQSARLQTIEKSHKQTESRNPPTVSLTTEKRTIAETLDNAHI